MNPLISVIIPVYNSEKYIEEALESVFKQSYSHYEIIAVDDGSSDNSSAILKRHGSLKYHYQPNSGPAAARNTGLRKAKGEYIAFIDSDDLWPDEKLQTQLNELKKTDKTDIIMGKIRYEELPGARSRDMLLDSENSFKYVNLGAGLFKKSVFEKAGYFDEKMRLWEDLDWFLRACENNISIRFTETIGMTYRVHQNNMSHNKKECNHFFRKVIKNSLDRRRNYTMDIDYSIFDNLINSNTANG